MSRPQVTLILWASLVILFALIGSWGFRAYKSYVETQRTLSLTRARHFALATSMLGGNEPEVDDELESTKTGIASEITIKNDSSHQIDSLTITELRYDNISLTTLPKTVGKIAPHKSVVLTLPVPGLKTTDPSFRKLSYKYRGAGGLVEASTSMGYPPVSSTHHPIAKGRS